MYSIVLCHGWVVRNPVPMAQRCPSSHATLRCSTRTRARTPKTEHSLGWIRNAKSLLALLTNITKTASDALYLSIHPFEPDPMSISENSPLLNGNWRHRPPRSLYQRTFTILKAEGEPSWLDSYRWFIFGSWLNLLLLLVPVAAAAHYLNWDAPLRFGFSFVAIIPLAKVRTTRDHHHSRDLIGSFLSCLAMRQNRCPCLSDRLLRAC